MKSEANDLEVLDNEICSLRKLLGAAYKRLSGKDMHMSDCATNDAPAITPRECDCTCVEGVSDVPGFEGTRESLNNL